ncbi:hypothetical protein [Allomuricauda sp. F6463D]|uniref:GNAT family N-acetyltransferase n=1 Tax=Allomuricauda sp. F6463D TaxID=2926409 RepID=UPI00293E01DD|nr:hypothetical protein [Muricauda sp. F6463D]
MTIRNMEPSDWGKVSKIYSEGIDTDIATFETEVPCYKNWDNAHTQHCRFVAKKMER